MKKIFSLGLLIMVLFSFTEISAFEASEKGEDVIEYIDPNEEYEENGRASRWWWTCADKDSYESNDSVSKATDLNIGDDGSRTIYGTIHKQPTRCGGSTDVDYYKFTVYKESNVYVTLSNIPSGKDYDLKIFDHTGKQVASSTNGSNRSESINKSMKTGNYYIKVYSYSGTSNSVLYKLYTKKTTTVGTTKNLNNESGITWQNEYIESVIGKYITDDHDDMNVYRINEVNVGNKKNYIIEYNELVPYRYTFINSEEIMLEYLEFFELQKIALEQGLNAILYGTIEPSITSDACDILGERLKFTEVTKVGKVAEFACAGINFVSQVNRNNAINEYTQAIEIVDRYISGIVNELEHGRTQMQIFTKVRIIDFYYPGMSSTVNLFFSTMTEISFYQYRYVNSNNIPNSSYSGYFI